MGHVAGCVCSCITPPPAAVTYGFLLGAAGLQLQFNSTRPTPRPTTPTPDLGLRIAVPSGLLSQSHRSPIGWGLYRGLYRDCDIRSPAPLCFFSCGNWKGAGGGHHSGWRLYVWLCMYVWMALALFWCFSVL